jgi:hypothetical protein
MTPATKRSIFRWIHILFGLPVVGYIYAPQAEVQPYVDVHRYFIMPMLLLSGLWLWKGAAISRLFVKKSPAPASE